MTTERLYREASEMGINIINWSKGEFKAATIEYRDDYCIFINQTKIKSNSEEKVVIAHEIGHCKTGTTHELLSPFDLISKHERKADKYAVSKLLSRTSLKAAVKKGNTESWQLAEYFNLPEDFICKAISIYKNY